MAEYGKGLRLMGRGAEENLSRVIQASRPMPAPLFWWPYPGAHPSTLFGRVRMSSWAFELSWSFRDPGRRQLEKTCGGSDQQEHTFLEAGPPNLARLAGPRPA